MADTEALEAKIESVQEKLTKRVQELEREVRELRAMQWMRTPSFVEQSKEERLAGVEKLRAFRERILERRGGVPLPSMADEIAKMREERTAQILGE